MINLLLDNIDKVVKDRIKIDFDTNFRIGIAFELMMQNHKYSIQAKTYQALKLFYPEMNKIKDTKKAIDDIVWFYSCGRSEEKTSQKNRKGKNKQIYSYEFDNDLIYSAFKNQYNVDLEEIEYLHWWKFRAMFNGLKSDNRIVEIMGYRAMDLSKIKDKEMKKHYKQLQEEHKLPDMRSEEEKEEDFAEALW
mgnify:FL=1